MCYKKMIVYQLSCYTCGKKYIGSTIRCLHQRFKEHVEGKEGIINIHKRYCHFPNFIPEIIDRVHGDNELELRIKEAILIQKMRPELNTKDELNKLIDFVL